MVVGEGKVHHGTDFDLAYDGNGALLDGVKSKDSGLGRVEDGGRKNGTVDPAVGDGEDTAFEVGQS